MRTSDTSHKITLKDQSSKIDATDLSVSKDEWGIAEKALAKKSFGTFLPYYRIRMDGFCARVSSFRVVQGAVYAYVNDEEKGRVAVNAEEDSRVDPWTLMDAERRLSQSAHYSSLSGTHQRLYISYGVKDASEASVLQHAFIKTHVGILALEGYGYFQQISATAKFKLAKNKHNELFILKAPLDTIDDASLLKEAELLQDLGASKYDKPILLDAVKRSSDEKTVLVLPYYNKTLSDYLIDIEREITDKTFDRLSYSILLHRLLDLIQSIERLHTGSMSKSRKKYGYGALSLESAAIDSTGRVILTDYSSVKQVGDGDQKLFLADIIALSKIMEQLLKPLKRTVEYQACVTGLICLVNTMRCHPNEIDFNFIKTLLIFYSEKPNVRQSSGRKKSWLQYLENQLAVWGCQTKNALQVVYIAEQHLMGVSVRLLSIMAVNSIIFERYKLNKNYRAVVSVHSNMSKENLVLLAQQSALTAFLVKYKDDARLSRITFTGDTVDLDKLFVISPWLSADRQKFDVDLERIHGEHQVLLHCLKHESVMQVITSYIIYCGEMNFEPVRMSRSLLACLAQLSFEGVHLLARCIQESYALTKQIDVISGLLQTMRKIPSFYSVKEVHDQQMSLSRLRAQDRLLKMFLRNVDIVAMKNHYEKIDLSIFESHEEKRNLKSVMPPASKLPFFNGRQVARNTSASQCRGATRLNAALNVARANSSAGTSSAHDIFSGTPTIGQLRTKK